MSDSTVEGKIHVIEDTKTYGNNGFRKRLLVIEQDKGRFTNYIPIEFTNDSCDTLDELSVGDEVEIPFRLNGRKWQRDPQSEVKFFLNAEGLSFRVLSNANQGSGTEEAPLPNPADYPPQMEDDDIPF